MTLPIFPTPVTPVPPAHGLPLWRLGFRPFYLGAAAFAALAVPAWLAMLAGALPEPRALPPLAWHAHEMLFGFAAAVIVGFLLTAGKAWTGLQTPRGGALAALAALWLAARVAALAAPPWLFALLDVALLPVVAAVLGTVLVRAGNRRNLPLVGLLLALAAANAGFHFAAAGLWPVSPLAPLRAALAIVVLVECVIGGRVVPAFTASATPGLRIETPAALARAAIAATAAALAAWVLLPAHPVTGALLGAAALAQAALLSRWHTGATRGRPILWILHAGYAFIPLGLALLAAAAFGALPRAAGVHALAVGATGGLVIGMITRTARGHTGRPLVASKAEVAAYGLVLAAAALRSLLAPVVAPALALPLAAAAWSAAFAIYCARFGPWLLAPRADGKDG